jgi:uncharacterized protein
MKKQRFFAILVLLLILGSQLFLLTGCNAESKEIPIPKAESNVYVYDDDNLFDESTQGQLNSMLIELEKQTGAEFAVHTIKSLLGKEIEDYSIKVANELGIGKKDKDNGVLLLISRSDKRVRLEIGKGLEGVLNDAKCGRILDEYFVPYRDNDEYIKATKLTVQAVINEIAKDAGVSINGVDQNITAPKPTEIPWGWVIGIILAIIIILIIINWYTDGAVVVFLSDISSSSDGDSGGGGFGGGGFGGGGASR